VKEKMLTCYKIKCNIFEPRRRRRREAHSISRYTDGHTMRMGMDGSTDLDSDSGEIPMIKISHTERE